MSGERLQAVLFDFDGVLADTLPLVQEILQRLAAAEGRSLPNRDELEWLRELDSRDLMVRAGIPARRVPALVRHVRNEIAGQAGELSTFDGLDEALRHLAGMGLSLGIVTSNGEEAVRRFLAAHGWEKRFSHCETGSSLFGKHRRIRRWLAREKTPATGTAYVGDETRDVEAARRSGTIAVAAGWGYATAGALQRCQPDGFAATPPALPGVLAALQKVR